MRVELVVDALEMAIRSRRPTPGLIFHSDRGIQYASRVFRTRLRGYQMRQSMSRRGNCWDTACAESFFAILKEGFGKDIFASTDQAREAVFEFIELFYNPIRMHGSIGFQSPNQFEESMVA